MGHAHTEPFPRPLLIAAAGLVITSVVMVALVRQERLRTGAALPPGVAASPATRADVVLARTFVLHEHEDGRLTVAALDGSVPARTFPAGEGGFVRGTIRALRHQRGVVGATGDPIVQIARLSDGRLIAEETASGMVLDLAAFGATNRAAFAGLLEPAAPAGPAGSLSATPAGTGAR